ncbi:hypothetical protein Tco_1008692 [Tanacetum coccineum]
MVESIPTMVDKHIKEQVEKQVPEQVKVQVPVYVAKELLLERQQNKEQTDKMIAYLEGKPYLDGFQDLTSLSLDKLELDE